MERKDKNRIIKRSLNKALFLFFVADVFALAQEFAPLHGPWTFLIKKDSVEAYFIYYTRADNTNDGVVIKLVNNNDYAVKYNFNAVFRSDTAEVENYAEGYLKANEIKTGSKEGLFFIPFKDGNSILEVGITRFRITRINK